jgi:hypothetical protein
MKRNFEEFEKLAQKGTKYPPPPPRVNRGKRVMSRLKTRAEEHVGGAWEHVGKGYTKIIKYV